MASSHQVLLRFLYNLVGNRGEAEALCQEVYLRAWRSWDQLRDPQRARAWLMQIARSLAVDAHRYRLRRPQAITLDVAGPCDGRDPGEPSDGRVEWVREALWSLPEETRSVLVLRVMEGLPGKEVANLLGISQAGVSRRLYEGLTQMKCRGSRDGVFD